MRTSSRKKGTRPWTVAAGERAAGRVGEATTAGGRIRVAFSRRIYKRERRRCLRGHSRGLRPLLLQGLLDKLQILHDRVERLAVDAPERPRIAQRVHRSVKRREGNLPNRLRPRNVQRRRQHVRPVHVHPLHVRPQPRHERLPERPVRCGEYRAKVPHAHAAPGNRMRLLPLKRVQSGELGPPHVHGDRRVILRRDRPLLRFLLLRILTLPLEP
mmetsp:Transcript_4538/g.20680  ORF Transcript_4538/g.20680 Transcript_4538/m.20680 type:complete len:214 (+) Transcript_4538:724-1365(+)